MADGIKFPSCVCYPAQISCLEDSLGAEREPRVVSCISIVVLATFTDLVFFSTETHFNIHIFKKCMRTGQHFLSRNIRT